MKRTVLGFALLMLAAFAWAAAPAAQPQPAATGAGAPLSKSTSSTLAADLGFVPKPIFTAGCTANTQCPVAGGTTTISCSGAGSCSVGTYSITCDGHTTYCGCVGCDFCRCDCLDGGGTGIQCVRECRFNC